MDEAGGKASWVLTNDSATTVTITRIVLDWPAGNLKLDRIRFDGSSIWNGPPDDVPPSDISSDLKGNRKLGGTEELPSKALSFEFTSSALPGGYSLQVELDIGCQISAGG